MLTSPAGANYRHFRCYNPSLPPQPLPPPSFQSQTVKAVMRNGRSSTQWGSHRWSSTHRWVLKEWCSSSRCSRPYDESLVMPANATEQSAALIDQLPARVRWSARAQASAAFFLVEFSFSACLPEKMCVIPALEYIQRTYSMQI